MRLALLAAASLLPFAVHAAIPELELAPGLAVSNDAAQTGPSLRARLGVRFPWFTPSLIAFGIGPSLRAG